jgi:O-antigen/teichoic acid export membrane protein
MDHKRLLLTALFIVSTSLILFIPLCYFLLPVFGEHVSSWLMPALYVAIFMLVTILVNLKSTERRNGDDDGRGHI